MMDGMVVGIGHILSPIVAVRCVMTMDSLMQNDDAMMDSNTVANHSKT